MQAHPAPSRIRAAALVRSNLARFRPALPIESEIMSPDLAPLALALGRALLGGLFVFGGVIHFFKRDELTPMIPARGVPFPRMTLMAGSAFQAVAGAALMLGLFVPFAALGLIAFTIAASVMLLNFWDMEGPMRETCFNIFLSNIALIGGLLVAAAA